ncbi:hypothetical protein TCON_2147 [Astathelohania contejeani]|uniref:Uncharacterized protein n=1 Tax=Astathelohania contejeani TaxID=164912 RepID=A0ABQ7HWU0_9MICR|nr:hypothetical protein TCON_2147 [Thelohania contejeani]
MILNTNVKKVIDILINVHGICSKQGFFNISNLEDTWKRAATIPLKKENYIQACLSYLRDPINTYEALRGMNVLSHNERGDYVYGYPVVLQDNQRPGRFLRIQRSPTEVIIGSVITERGIANGALNTGLISRTVIRCTFLEFLRARAFFDIFFKYV